MSIIISISGVCERDIDLLFVEEFRSSMDFCSWFCRKTIGSGFKLGQVLAVQRSVTQSAGESDIELSFTDAGNAPWRLLIENKVDAALQPQQAARYHTRGSTYRSRGDCIDFRTVLLAPERYLGTPLDLKGFGCAITYESVVEWYLSNNSLGERKAYKIELLTRAIEKSTLGYQPNTDQSVSYFWRQYHSMAWEHAPELQMPVPPPKPSGAGFIYFPSPLLPSGVTLCHKLPHGNVDLQFAGMGTLVHSLHDIFSKHVNTDMGFQKANKSGVIRLNVPPLNTAIVFSEQRTAVLEGILAAKRLHAWICEHRVIWEEYKRER